MLTNVVVGPNFRLWYGFVSYHEDDVWAARKGNHSLWTVAKRLSRSQMIPEIRDKCVKFLIITLNCLFTLTGYSGWVEIQFAANHIASSEYQFGSKLGLVYHFESRRERLRRTPKAPGQPETTISSSGYDPAGCGFDCWDDFVRWRISSGSWTGTKIGIGVWSGEVRWYHCLWY